MQIDMQDKVNARLRELVSGSHASRRESNNHAFTFSCVSYVKVVTNFLCWFFINFQGHLIQPRHGRLLGRHVSCVSLDKLFPYVTLRWRAKALSVFCNICSTLPSWNFFKMRNIAEGDETKMGAPFQSVVGQRVDRDWTANPVFVQCMSKVCPMSVHVQGLSVHCPV